MNNALNNDSLVESTTIKTIRNLKLKNSYSKFPTNGENDVSQNDNANSYTQPQTPPQYEDKNPSILQQKLLEGSYNTEAILQSRYPKSRPGSSSVLKNPMRKGSKDRMVKQLSSCSEMESDLQMSRIKRGSVEQSARKMNGVMRTSSVNPGEPNLERDLLNFNPTSSDVLANIKVKEYDIIDINYGIQFVMTKSKVVTERLEDLQVSQEFVEQKIIRNKFFQISYNSMLQNMIQLKQINAQFKNVSKRSFEKLESFFLERIDKAIQQSNLQHNYLKHSKGIYSTLNKKMQELQKELEDSQKIQL